MRKLLIISILLLLNYSNNVFANNEVFTHLGISVMREENKSIVYFAQINGSLMPSITREIVPYSAWGQRLYGYVGIGINRNNNYSFGMGYYLGRIGAFGIQIGIQNYKNPREDEFVVGCYIDTGVFKVLTKKLDELIDFISKK